NRTAQESKVPRTGQGRLALCVQLRGLQPLPHTETVGAVCMNAPPRLALRQLVRRSVSTAAAYSIQISDCKTVTNTDMPNRQTFFNKLLAAWPRSVIRCSLPSAFRHHGRRREDAYKPPRFRLMTCHNRKSVESPPTSACAEACSSASREVPP